MTGTLTPEAAAFLAAVQTELADLPDDDAAELTEDVESHLAEAAADGRLAELGSPAQYAAELRTAAGLPPRVPEPDAGWRAVSAVRAWTERVTGTRAYREVRAFAPELRPAWWVLRGYLLVVVLSWQSHYSLHEVLPVPHVSGNALVGLVTTLAAVTASVAWGRRHRTYARWQHTATVVANAAAAVLAIGLMNDVVDRSGERVYYTSHPDGLQGPYGRVHEMYPYDSEGRPLDGVVLYDQDGNVVAPMICAGYCQRLSFPLYDAPVRPDLRGEPFGLTSSPTPSPTPTPTPTPTSAPSPTTTPKASRSPR